MTNFKTRLSGLLLLGAMSISLAACGTSDSDSPSTSSYEPTSSEKTSDSGEGGGSSSAPAEVTPTIHFNTQGGSTIASITGKKGDAIDYSKYVPTKEGAEFIGWYGSADGGTAAPKTFDGEQTVYAYWSGMFGKAGYYFGHYPQSKVTNTSLKAAIKSLGERKPYSDDYVYEGKTYRRTGSTSVDYEFYSFDLIKWNWKKNTDNVYTLTAASVLDYRQMFDSGDIQGDSYNEKVAYIKDFTHSSLYEHLNDNFYYDAFSQEERKDLEGSIVVPTFNGEYQFAYITDWVFEASDYAFTGGTRYDSLVGGHRPGSEKEDEIVYPYWFKSWTDQAPSGSSTTKPLCYNIRSWKQLGSNAVETREFVDNYCGVVPQVKVNLNKMATRTLHFNTEGGSPAVEDVTGKAKLGTEVTVNLPDVSLEKEDYNFKWWSKTKGGSRYTGDTYTFGAQETEATLYAVWEYDTSTRYSAVTYHLNGGTANPSAPATVSSDYTIYSQLSGAIPTYDRYHEFLGWYLDEALTTPLPTDKKTRKPIDLYAKWGAVDILDADFKFNPISDGEAYEISVANGVQLNGEVELPAAYKDGKPVTKVADNGFKNQSGITSFVVPNSYTEIGSYAFSGTGLTEFVMPEGIAYGSGVFANCTSLQSVVLPDDMEAVPNYMFSGCTSLRSVSFPEACKTLNYNSFSNTALDELRIDSSFTSINVYAFSDANIGKVYLDEGFNSSFDGETIYFMGSIGEFHISTGVTSLPEGIRLKEGTKAYIDCGLDQWCSFGVNADTILQAVDADDIYFSNDHLSGDLVINSGNYLPSYTLKGANITSLTLPNTMTSYGDYAFSGVGENLTELNVPNANPLSNYSMPKTQITKITVRTVTYNINSYFNGYSALKDLRLETVTNNSYGALSFSYASSVEKLYVGGGYISSSALQNLTNLKEVTLPTMSTSYFGTNLGSVEKLTILSGSVSSNSSHPVLTNLKYLVIGENVTNLYQSAFANYTTLESVEFAGTPKISSIASYAFENTALKSFELPASVSSCGSNIFKNCDSMTTLTVASGNQYYDSRDNCNCILQTNPVMLIAKIPTSVIPDSVTIASDGFYSDVNQDTFVVPAKMTEIRNGAFSGATIRVLDLSSNPSLDVKSGALNGINGLEELILPGMSVSLVNLFGGDYSYIPNSLTTIRVTAGDSLPENAFRTTTTYGNNITTIEIPDTVTALPNYAFGYLQGLSGELSLPHIITVGDYVFRGCTNLTSINIPSATTLGYGAFIGCTNLETVDMSSVSGIYGGDQVGIFYNCKSLGVITLPSTFDKARKGDYVYPFQGAEIEGVIIGDGTTVLLETLFFQAKLDWVYIPTTVTKETIGGTYYNQVGSATQATIGKVFYGGTNASTFTSLLDGKDSSNNPNFCDNSKSVYKEATLYLYSETSKSGNYWHWVNGVPTPWNE